MVVNNTYMVITSGCFCPQVTEHPAAKDRAEAWPWGATPRPRSGWWGGGRPRAPGCDGAGAAEASYPTSEVRGGGQEELPHAQGQGRWPRGATLRPRSCAGASGPRGATPHSRSGEGVREKVPLVQGKEQRLHFAGAAVKRYPTSKPWETQVRQ